MSKKRDEKFYKSKTYKVLCIVVYAEKTCKKKNFVQNVQKFLCIVVYAEKTCKKKEKFFQVDKIFTSPENWTYKNFST